MIANMIHDLSDRSDKPFMGLNCAALPESLLESELFGYERGAFTGAAASKPGLLEAADGGTVFLDEIGDLTPNLQAKLLRVVETLEVTRLGSLKSQSVDVRFVTATNRDIKHDIRLGRFRQDLYFRLNTVTLVIPPLRKRPSEIESLARLFLQRAYARVDVGEARFSPSALAALAAHTWPGNVRELKNAVERAVLFADGRPIIEMHDLGLPASQSGPDPSSDDARITEVSEISSSPDAERARIVRALAEYGGNQGRAAKALGMSRRTLVRRLAKLNVPRPRDRI
jgi:transcriptional regulator with PAS, ATPase and Fis domain